VTRTRIARFARRLAVSTGVVAAVVLLAGTALAAVPLTTVSTDPYTNASSYHQTELEPDTFSFGSTVVAAFQTGRFYDGGADNIGWATSTNAGASWTHGFLPGTTVYATPSGPWARISDPSVAYDPKDGVWMIAGLAIDSSVTGKAVLVSRSTDGGLTWQNPVTVSLGGGSAFYDKNWIGCDATSTSPFFGNCYVEWDNANAANALRMSRSTDGGLSWTDSSTPSTGVIGGQPLAQPSGRVVVPIVNVFNGTIASFVSDDGGASYNGPHTISGYNDHLVAGGLRTSVLPSAEVDAAGRVYVVWQDCRFRSGCAANDAVMSTSTNGTTWSSVVRIPIASLSSTIDVFIPSIGVDRTTSGSTARLGVTTYGYPNRSCSASTCRLYAAFVSSTDGGATWSAPQILFGPITLSWLANTNQGRMVGDYDSTSWAGGKAFPVIADATAGTCATGNPTACHEFMVAPTNGLVAGPGVVPVGRERPVALSPAAPRPHASTAF
jgi:hypothetical protein